MNRFFSSFSMRTVIHLSKYKCISNIYIKCTVELNENFKEKQKKKRRKNRNEKNAYIRFQSFSVSFSTTYLTISI